MSEPSRLFLLAAPETCQPDSPPAACVLTRPDREYIDCCGLYGLDRIHCFFSVCMGTLKRASSLSCFFAMALRDAGSDTEELYWNKLKPLCKSMNISAIRIDELEHFDNIDQRILSEIENSDFMVANLTYERPSVYFEAGYAERKPMPVIYTCRADHFSPSDRLSFRIHFDIRQRPIIRWTKPDDAVFSRRLRRRITKAAVPLLKKRTENLRNHKAETEFSRLSLRSRAIEIVNSAKQLLTRLGFRSVATEQQMKKESGWIGYKTARVRTDRVAVVASGGTKSDLQRLGLVRLLINRIPIGPHRSAGTDEVVLLCLGRIPSPRIDVFFHDYSRVNEGAVRTWEKPDENRLSRIHVVDKIRSPMVVVSALRMAFK